MATHYDFMDETFVDDNGNEVTPPQSLRDAMEFNLTFGINMLNVGRVEDAQGQFDALLKRIQSLPADLPDVEV